MLAHPQLQSTRSRSDCKDPREILRYAFETYDAIAISFSGAEDVVLIDMALNIRPDIAVFSLDTGRLHPDTYVYLDTVRTHYGIELELLYPDFRELETLVRNKGLFSFYDDGHNECCAVRKVAPLRRKLAVLDAWITGQRRDQSVGTRHDLPTVQADPAFAGAGRKLMKFNPLAGWCSAEVWSYIQTNGVPYNPLHTRGFTSIGCAPCTRAILPNQHEREGRWWWEHTSAKECGLHAGNQRCT